jgi:hypothetical protein
LRSAVPPADAAPTSTILARAHGTQGAWRWFDEFVLTCRSGTRLMRRDLRGYQDPLLLKGYERAVDAMGAHPELAAQLNVRFVLSGPHFLHDGWDHHYLPRDVPGRVIYRDSHGRRVIEREDAMPFAYFVPASEVELAPDRQRALQRTIELAPSAIAILDPIGDAPRVHGRAQRTAARSSQTQLQFRSDSLDFEIDAPREGVVVVNEVYYPGWTASVDGAQTPILRANGLVRAIAISAGHHRVAMRFEPADGVWTRRLAVLTWLAMLAVLLATWLRTRRRSPAPAPGPGP